MQTRIGIAGYMGAGKSTCARMFNRKSALIIDADVEAKKFMMCDRQLQNDLCNTFEDTIIGDDNNLRFDILADKVFQSIDTLRMFNSIVHPPIIAHIKNIIENCDHPLCILDAALIPLWNDAANALDLRIWVDVDFDIRFARLSSKRNDIDGTELSRRMKLQEEVMSVPRGDGWVVLSDDEVYDYISQSSLRT